MDSSLFTIFSVILALLFSSTVSGLSHWDLGPLGGPLSQLTSCTLQRYWVVSGESLHSLHLGSYPGGVQFGARRLCAVSLFSQEAGSIFCAV